MQTYQMPEFYTPYRARLNPHLQIAREHTKIWAKQVGILGKSLPPVWDESSFDRHDYALLCAYIHPEVPADELSLMADWNVWAFYVDDYFLQVYKRPKDRRGAKAYLDRVLLFMPADISACPNPTNPMEEGLIDLWQRTAPTKSLAWRKRIIDDTRNLLEAFLWEVDSMGLRRVANPIEYIEMRRQVGAALWSADLVEHAMFVEIPERIANTRPLLVLKETFADGVHLRNDIFSYDREVHKEGELTNAVLVIERFMGIDAQAAIYLVNDLLTSRLKQFEYTANVELKHLFDAFQVTAEERASVATYIRGLQEWQYGAHEWHVQTTRYLQARAGLPPKTASIKFQFGTKGFGSSGVHIPAGLKRFRHTPYQRVEPIPLPSFYMPFTVQAHPYMETANKNSEKWAHEMGILTPHSHPSAGFTWDQRQFDAANIALFCSLAYPSASDAQLELATRWLVWATYMDDYGTEVFGHTHDLPGAKRCLERLKMCMPIENATASVSISTPLERGLADLWAFTTKPMSIQARQSFRKATEDMVEIWQWEIWNRSQHYIPEIIDYMEMRRKTAGLDFMMAFIRSVYGQEIPSEIYQTLTMKELLKSAGDYVYLTNDLVSYQKEIVLEGDIHNAVLVIQNFLNCDSAQAAYIIGDLMTARLKQFEHLKETGLQVLIENFALDEHTSSMLFRQVKELENLVSASLYWHTTVNRYKELERSNFGWNLQGIGRSLMQISPLARK